ncbi:YciI family protein [Streptomyces sp. NPDC001858]
MEFFCFHRDRAGALALRHELSEAHWAYMDRYATELIARGPTFGADTEADADPDADADVPSGSVHIVELPDAAAARAFAFDEPNYQAGVYRDVLLRRWRNLLGRTMWEFPGGRGEGSRDRYLVLGLGGGPGEASGEVDLAVPARWDDDRLIAYGPLLSDDGTVWVGTAALVRADGPDAAREVLTPGRYADIEVHAWEFGGRR